MVTVLVYQSFGINLCVDLDKMLVESRIKNLHHLLIHDPPNTDNP